MKRTAIFLVFIIGVAVSACENPARPNQGDVVRAACERIKNNGLVIDVRTKKEYESGHVRDAVNIPHNRIEKEIEEIESNKDRDIILYCVSGWRSSIALKKLRKKGYTKAFDAAAYKALINAPCKELVVPPSPGKASKGAD